MRLTFTQIVQFTQFLKFIDLSQSLLWIQFFPERESGLFNLSFFSFLDLIFDIEIFEQKSKILSFSPTVPKIIISESLHKLVNFFPSILIISLSLNIFDSLGKKLVQSFTEDFSLFLHTQRFQISFNKCIISFFIIFWGNLWTQLKRWGALSEWF